MKRENQRLLNCWGKAVDDHTLQYTLNQPESFWNSKLTTATMMPVNEKVLGISWERLLVAETKWYPLQWSIHFESFTSKSQIELDKTLITTTRKNVHIDTVKLTYFDGSDQDYLARNFSEKPIYCSSLPNKLNLQHN